MAGVLPPSSEDRRNNDSNNPIHLSLDPHSKENRDPTASAFHCLSSSSDHRSSKSAHLSEVNLKNETNNDDVSSVKRNSSTAASMSGVAMRTGVVSTDGSSSSMATDADLSALLSASLSSALRGLFYIIEKNSMNDECGQVISLLAQWTTQFRRLQETIERLTLDERTIDPNQTAAVAFMVSSLEPPNLGDLPGFATNKGKKKPTQSDGNDEHRRQQSPVKRGRDKERNRTRQSREASLDRDPHQTSAEIRDNRRESTASSSTAEVCGDLVDASESESNSVNQGTTTTIVTESTSSSSMISSRTGGKTWGEMNSPSDVRQMNEMDGAKRDSSNDLAIPESIAKRAAQSSMSDSNDSHHISGDIPTTSSHARRTVTFCKTTAANQKSVACSSGKKSKLNAGATSFDSTKVHFDVWPLPPRMSSFKNKSHNQHKLLSDADARRRARAGSDQSHRNNTVVNQQANSKPTVTNTTTTATPQLASSSVATVMDTTWYNPATYAFQSQFAATVGGSAGLYPMYPALPMTMPVLNPAHSQPPPVIPAPLLDEVISQAQRQLMPQTVVPVIEPAKQPEVHSQGTQFKLPTLSNSEQQRSSRENQTESVKSVTKVDENEPKHSDENNNAEQLRNGEKEATVEDKGEEEEGEGELAVKKQRPVHEEVESSADTRQRPPPQRRRAVVHHSRQNHKAVRKPLAQVSHESNRSSQNPTMKKSISHRSRSASPAPTSKSKPKMRWQRKNSPTVDDSAITVARVTVVEEEEEPHNENGLASSSSSNGDGSNREEDEKSSNNVCSSSSTTTTSVNHFGITSIFDGCPKKNHSHHSLKHSRTPQKPAVRKRGGLNLNANAAAGSSSSSTSSSSSSSSLTGSSSHSSSNATTTLMTPPTKRSKTPTVWPSLGSNHAGSSSSSSSLSSSLTTNTITNSTSSSDGSTSLTNPSTLDPFEHPLPHAVAPKRFGGPPKKTFSQIASKNLPPSKKKAVISMIQLQNVSHPRGLHGPLNHRLNAPIIASGGASLTGKVGSSSMNSSSSLLSSSNQGTKATPSKVRQLRARLSGKNAEMRKEQALERQRKAEARRAKLQREKEAKYRRSAQRTQLAQLRKERNQEKKKREMETKLRYRLSEAQKRWEEEMRQRVRKSREAAQIKKQQNSRGGSKKGKSESRSVSEDRGKKKDLCELSEESDALEMRLRSSSARREERLRRIQEQSKKSFAAQEEVIRRKQELAERKDSIQKEQTRIQNSEEYVAPPTPKKKKVEGSQSKRKSNDENGGKEETGDQSGVSAAAIVVVTSVSSSKDECSDSITTLINEQDRKTDGNGMKSSKKSTSSKKGTNVKKSGNNDDDDCVVRSRSSESTTGSISESKKKKMKQNPQRQSKKRMNKSDKKKAKKKGRKKHDRSWECENSTAATIRALLLSDVSEVATVGSNSVCSESALILPCSSLSESEEKQRMLMLESIVIDMNREINEYYSHTLSKKNTWLSGLHIRSDLRDVIKNVSLNVTRLMKTMSNNSNKSIRCSKKKKKLKNKMFTTISSDSSSNSIMIGHSLISDNNDSLSGKIKVLEPSLYQLSKLLNAMIQSGGGNKQRLYLLFNNQSDAFRYLIDSLMDLLGDSCATQVKLNKKKHNDSGHSSFSSSSTTTTTTMMLFNQITPKSQELIFDALNQCVHYSLDLRRHLLLSGLSVRLLQVVSDLISSPTFHYQKLTMNRAKILLQIVTAALQGCSVGGSSSSLSSSFSSVIDVSGLPPSLSTMASSKSGVTCSSGSSTAASASESIAMILRRKSLLLRYLCVSGFFRKIRVVFGRINARLCTECESYFHLFLRVVPFMAAVLQQQIPVSETQPGLPRPVGSLKCPSEVALEMEQTELWGLIHLVSNLTIKPQSGHDANDSSDNIGASSPALLVSEANEEDFVTILASSLSALNAAARMDIDTFRKVISERGKELKHVVTSLLLYVKGKSGVLNGDSGAHLRLLCDQFVMFLGYGGLQNEGFQSTFLWAALNTNVLVLLSQCLPFHYLIVPYKREIYLSTLISLTFGNDELKRILDTEVCLDYIVEFIQQHQQQSEEERMTKSVVDFDMRFPKHLWADALEFFRDAQKK